MCDCETNCLNSLLHRLSYRLDHVDRGIIIEKLKPLGVPEFIVRWTTSFLCERQQRVKISDVASNWTELRGVFLVAASDLYHHH